jgi:hypothetical protein
MPYIKIPPVNKKHGNSGTCKALVNYLEKENKNKTEEDQELFFNQNEDYIGKTKAERIIAHNVDALGKKDAKFYEVIVSFSKPELKGRTDEELRQYIKGNFAQDYAKSVNGREIEANSIVFVAKLERDRKYKGIDSEVLDGTRKKGELKDGDNRHFHIIVARKTLNGRKISPLTHHINTTKGTVTGGFSQNGLKQNIEDSFDESFKYERGIEEKFSYNTLSESEKQGLALNQSLKQEVEILKVEENQRFKGLKF